MLKNTLHKIVDYFKSTDLVFFIFLILILNVSIVVKMIAILFIYAFRPNFKFGIKTGRLPLFYLAIIILFMLQVLVNYGLWSKNYFFLSGLGLSYWFTSFLVIHQVKMAIEKGGADGVHKSLTLFFILNSVISFLNILLIIFSTKVLNPYTYEGMSLKYHVSTGDWITGATQDFSLTNSFISLLGVIYFLYNRNYLMAIISLIIMLLATSNAITLFLLITIACILFFDRNKFHKSMAVIFIGIIIIFYARISPENIDYTVNTIQSRPAEHTVVKYQDTTAIRIETLKKTQKDLLLKYMSIKTKNKDTIVPSTSSIEKEFKITTALQNMLVSETNKSIKLDKATTTKLILRHTQLLEYIKTIYGDTVVKGDRYFNKKYPGKIISFLETKDYILLDFRKFMIGSGAGLFSSKLAFKASGVGEFGKYPEKYAYISKDFKDNHMKIYTYYFLQTPDKHSVTNNPFSVYNQLLGEYGLIGLLMFIILYVWYFLRCLPHLTYGRFLLPLCIVFLTTDYWFEHLSVLVIFETMMFLDIYNNTNKKSTIENKNS